MAKEFWEADERVSSEGEFWKGDEPAAKQALPADVKPSEAGGGRGSVNPPILAARRVAPEGEVDLSRPAGVLARDIKRGTAPDKRSLLERSVEGNTEGERARRVRQERRANWEQDQISPFTPSATGATRPKDDTDANRGANFASSAVGSNPVGRAVAKVGTGIAQGLGGITEAVGDVTGIEPLARVGKSTAEGAQAFEKGMGKGGDIEGFGPRSPVPYLAEQAEGAATSLGQSAVLAAGLGAKAVIPVQAILQGGQSYNEARQAGLDPATALARAVPQGAFEAIGEKFSGLDRVASAMGTLLQKGAGAAAKRTAANVLVRSGIREIPGEVMTYLGQTGTDLIPGIGLNPDMTMEQFIDGLRDTVVQAGMMGGAVGGGGMIGRRGAPAGTGLPPMPSDAPSETPAPVATPEAAAAATPLPEPAAQEMAAAPIAPVAPPAPPAGPLARAAATVGTLNDGIVTGERDPSARPKSLAEQNAAMTEIARIEAEQDAENELAAAVVTDEVVTDVPATNAPKEASNETAKPDAPKDDGAATTGSPDRANLPDARGDDSPGRADAPPMASSVPGQAPALSPDPTGAAGLDDGQLATARPADSAGKPEKAPRAAPPARRGREASAPAAFESVEAAADFLRQQRARGTSIVALPHTDDAGTVTLATKGTPEYERALDQREQRLQAKAREAAGIREGDLLTKSGGAFKAKVAAINAQKVAGSGHSVVPVKGGFVVRREATNVSATSNVPGMAAAATELGGDNAGGGVATELGGARASGRAAVPAAPLAAGEQGAVLPPADGADAPLNQRDETPAARVDIAANEAATSPLNDKPEPTDAQKKAGNYAMGHLSGKDTQGIDITIENPKGSGRRGTSPDGTAWANKMGAHYGYAKRSQAADGDHVDMFIGPAADRAQTVWVIDQVNADGTYDEAKAMFGFMNKTAALKAYKSSYSKDWKVGPVTAMSVAEFKAGLERGRFMKPLDSSLATPAAPAPAPAPAPAAKPKREVKTAGIEALPFSRSAAEAGDTVAKTQATVDAILSKWANAPNVVVAKNMDDPAVPAAVRQHNEGQRAQGAEGEPEGFFYAGKVYLLADQLGSTREVARVLFHEALGHYGLRGVFGAELRPILKQLAGLRRAEVEAKARAYGLDIADEQQRLMAAEEVLAEMAEKTPSIGFVRRAIAAVRAWLRANVPGFKSLELSDAEIVRDYLLPARGWVERGHRLEGAPGAAMPAFSRGESTLRELSKADDLFALPKSDKMTVEGIAKDNDPKFTVKKLQPFAGRTDYQLTTPDGSYARLFVREPNPYGPSVYDSTRVDGEDQALGTERPGENPQDVPPTGDVWIDVSLLTQGAPADFGAKIYNIAATYAHNTGRIFIGDPNGLSKTALRRRLEHMISSALKFGTTAHLAPHPDQVRGGHGVPGLRWIYGDHVGNVERMIAASVRAMDNAFPRSSLIEYDPDSGTFRRQDNGAGLGRGQLALGLRESIRKGRRVVQSGAAEGEAGWRTVARTALFRALARREGTGAGGADGRSDGLLEQLLRNAPGLSDEKVGWRIFYSRSAVRPDSGAAAAPAGASGHQRGDARADGAAGASDRLSGTAGAPPAKPNPALARAIFGGALEWTRDQNGKPVKVSAQAEKYKAIDTDERGQMLLRKGHITADQLKRWKESKLDIYEGAVNNRFRKHFESPGIVWKDAELRDIFKLEDAAIAAYRDLRATADTSIARHAVADMLRLAGEDGHAVREQVLGEPLEVASETLRDRLLALATANPERNKVLTDRANGVIGIADEANERMAAGFVPDDMKADARPSDWESPAPGLTDRIIYEFQDGKVDLKRTQEAITRAGNGIDERFDARLAETLYSGRVAKRSESFLEVEALPLLRMMARMGIGQDELGDYLHARGAPERNAQIAKVNPDMPDGGAGANSKGLLLTTEAAKQYIADLPEARRAQLEQLAAKVDGIISGTRQLLVAEGLEKAETIEAWEAAYKNYVPMFREDVEFSRLTVHKRATGSDKKAVNILSHVLMQREAAITRAEKNRVSVALYGLALTNPNPSFWVTIRPDSDAATIQQDLQRMGVDPLVAEAGMQGVPTIRTVDPATNQVVERLNPMYRQLPGAISVKINGEHRVLLLNEGDPRAMRLAAAMKGQDQLTELDIAGSIVGRTTRWLAAVNTQYNPVFGLVNFMRDTMGGVINLGSTELRSAKARVMGGILPASAGIYRVLTRAEDKGKWGELFEQFQQDGGQTGFRELFRDGGERARNIEQQLTKMSKAGKLNPLVVPRMMLSLLDGFNTLTENAVRLSAYAAALDKGMSRPAAARLARELTVDFNRKGRATREIGPLYAFFNAAVQGNERTLRVLRGPTGAKIISGGLALGVIQALMLAAAGYDEDEIPEFAKARAFIIPLFGQEKKYISIPLPLGLHVLPNTGRVLTEMVIGDHKGMGKKAFDALGEILGAFNPLGGGNVTTLDGLLRTAAPTVVDPFIELGFNKNFVGNQIERDARGESDSRPGAARAREGMQRQFTGQVYIGISKALNELSGGSAFEAGVVSPTPERLRYIAQIAGGGVVRELEKIINSSVAASRGEKVPASTVPVVGRFYGEVDRDLVARSRYYEGSKRIEQLEGSLRAAKKARDAEAVERLQRTRPEIGLINANNRAQQAIQKLNKQAVQIIGDRETMQEIDQRRFETMRALSDAIREMERSQRPPTIAERLNGASTNRR